MKYVPILFAIVTCVLSAFAQRELGVRPTETGGPFKDVRELRKLLVQDEASIARNLVRQLAAARTLGPKRQCARAEWPPGASRF